LQNAILDFCAMEYDLDSQLIPKKKKPKALGLWLCIY